VRAESIAHPDSIPKIIELATELDITDLYIQVVVAGYAYYHSKILPRSQYLSKVSSPEYDPLASFIKIAHNRSIRIHAWVNVFLVWSLPKPPDSLRHILYTHPEWFVKNIHQRSMSEYSYQEWKGLGLEGLYLDPGHQEVQRHLVKVCTEIVTKYPVNGIHFDFIRYPGILWGIAEEDKSAIFVGPEADTLKWLNLVRYPGLPFYYRWMVWHYWQLNREKEIMINQTVQNIANMVKGCAIKKDCAVSAAVFANPSLGRYRFAQNWLGWEGSIDFPIIMSYTRNIGLFLDFLNYTLIHNQDAVFGIGLLWPDMESVAALERELTSCHSGAGICYFDFTNIDTMVDLQKLKKEVAFEESLILSDTTNYPTVSPVFSDEPIFDFVKEGEGFIGWGQDLEFAAFLLSLSLNPIRDLTRMELNYMIFLEKIHQDVAAFEFFDHQIFPPGNKLIEPPKRRISYSFFPWDDDSLNVATKALQVKELSCDTIIYSRSLDRLAQAVFTTEKNRQELLKTPEGIYVFKVKKSYKGGKTVKRQRVKPEILPIYLNWTIKTRFKKIARQ